MGTVFDIQRCSYHDGPGIRTTVFLKGCPLRCAWCHNPESFEKKPQLRFVESLCVRCAKCVAVCPKQVHTCSADGKRTVDFSRCDECGLCVRACPAGALEIIGKEMSASEIMDIVRRDKVYYGEDGGLTVSGGEPTFQAGFLLEILKKAKEEQINTAIETNGYIPESTLDNILPFTDTFLVDFKLTKEEGLTSLTHADGSLWEKTMKKLNSSKKNVLLRLPVIPGINDTEEHMKAAAQIALTYPCISETEIMPYHAIGADKWEQTGLHYSLQELKTATPGQAEKWKAMLTAALKEAGWHR